MQFDKSDPRIVVTSGGTVCLYDEAGRFVGTITRPVDRQPVGPGREKVFLARPSVVDANAA
jgi:hypothetical protein